MRLHTLASLLIRAFVASAVLVRDEPKVSIIFELETINPGFHDLVARPSGTLLVTHLWHIDPDRGTGK